MQARQRKNLMVIAPCLVAIGIMCTLVAYSPTLYRMFCAATGLAGTTQRVAADTARISKQTVIVAFDTNVAPGLPWRFEPAQGAVTVHLGEQKLVYFTAENLSNESIVGHATFNVTPLRSGIYFNKIQCFCFSNERLGPHEKVRMPVVFYVDPAFGKDADMHDVAQLTLGYTFFRAADPLNAKDLSRFLATNPPDPVEGRDLFNERCAACHALDANKFGPRLGGVFGRRAGVGTRLRLFAGAKERRPELVGGQPRPLARRSATIHSRRENAGQRSRPTRAPGYRRLSAAGERAAAQRRTQE